MFKKSSEQRNRFGTFNFLFNNYLALGGEGLIEHIKEDLKLLDSEILYNLALSVLPSNNFFDSNEISFKLMELSAEKEFPLAF